MLFYLGAHTTGWLATAGVPLFLSARRLRQRVRLPRAAARWALDSGGFTEISKYGRWQTSAGQYAVEARRWADGIGNLDWAAPQDWMCEPQMVAKTGLSVAEHQRRTVDSVLELRALEPAVHWIPVLQGWTLGDYLRCCELYAAAGIDLRAEPTVGLGSVCRRQGSVSTTCWINWLADEGIKLHGFGFARKGLYAAATQLASSDSMAWSYRARKDGDGQQNSLSFALNWRDELLARLERLERERRVV